MKYITALLSAILASTAHADGSSLLKDVIHIPGMDQVIFPVPNPGQRVHLCNSPLIGKTTFAEAMTAVGNFNAVVAKPTIPNPFYVAPGCWKVGATGNTVIAACYKGPGAYSAPVGVADVRDTAQYVLQNCGLASPTHFNGGASSTGDGFVQVWVVPKTAGT